jgi:hypothetical protein
MGENYYSSSISFTLWRNPTSTRAYSITIRIEHDHLDHGVVTPYGLKSWTGMFYEAAISKGHKATLELR